MARRREHSRETLTELALCAAERLLDGWDNGTWAIEAEDLAIKQFPCCG